MQKRPKMPDKKGNHFKRQWKMLLPRLQKRLNFDANQLEQLTILCDLYQEYYDLTEIIAKEGHTYTVESRAGNQIKPRPEIAIRANALKEIRYYLKFLDLNPKTIEGEEDFGDDDDWS